MKKWKKSLDSADKEYSEKEQESETLKLEVQTLEKEAESYQSQITETEQGS